MLSFHVKFVQTDRRTDRRTMVKQYAPDLLILGHKNNNPTELQIYSAPAPLTHDFKIWHITFQGNGPVGHIFSGCK